MKKNLDLGLLLIRLSIGFPMLVYGISKLRNGVDFITGLLFKVGIPEFIGYGVYLGEVFAPILIIIGLRTRLAGVIFAANCLTAIVLTQATNIFKLNTSGGWAAELLVIYLIVSMALVFTGGGKLSVSHVTKWD